MGNNGSQGAAQKICSTQGGWAVLFDYQMDIPVARIHPGAEQHMSNSIIFRGAGETASLGSSWKLKLESMPSGSGTALPDTQELLWHKEKGARGGPDPRVLKGLADGAQQRVFWSSQGMLSAFS